MSDQLLNGLFAGGIAVALLLVVGLVAPKQTCSNCGHKFPKFGKTCPNCKTKIA